MILQTSSYIPGGIGILWRTHGLCSMTGITTGGKKSSWKRPLCESSHTNPWFWIHMKWCMSSHSCGQRKSPACTLSMITRLSAVYLPIGVKGGGFGDKIGMSAKGSPMMFCTIRNFSGKLANTGQILRATGLYFLEAKVSTSRSCEGVSRSGRGTRRVWSECEAETVGTVLIASEATEVTEGKQTE